MSYTVKNVKTFVGMEGYGFNASLYRDGKKVAFVIDEGNGGCYLYDWVSKEEERALVSALPREETTLFSMSLDTFVAALVDDYEEAKKLRKECRTNTVVKMKGDKAGEYTVFKVPFSPATETWIRAKYGDAVLEIINLR